MNLPRARSEHVWGAGNMHALTMFLPRWLASLSRAGSDISRHAVVVALGRRAYDFCHSQRRGFGHHCVRDHHWPGPEEPYQFAQDWYVRGPVLHAGLWHCGAVSHIMLAICPTMLLLLLLLLLSAWRALLPVAGMGDSRSCAGMWR